MFNPRHAHPFTPEEALLLDPPTITAEVARLRHSIARLGESNQALREYLADEGFDQELASSIDENERTIASQHERIALLQWALASHVGVGSAGHYAGASSSTDLSTSGQPSAASVGPPGLQAIGFADADQEADSRQSAFPIVSIDGTDADHRSIGEAEPLSTRTAPGRPSDTGGDDDGVHL